LARVLQNQTGNQEEARKLYMSVAKERELPPPPADSKEKPFAGDDGYEVTPQDLYKLRHFADLSYAEEADRQLSILKGLPTSR
jgi:hypothetical protein